MANTPRTTEPVASIPLPSADYIGYRFDQNDKNVKELKEDTREQLTVLISKFDEMTTTVATKQELKDAQELGDKKHDDIWAAINDIKKNTRWWVGTVISIVAIAAVLLTQLRK